MLKSLLIISRGMWEPIGVVFAVSIVWSLIRMIFFGEWRNAVRWCYFVGGIGALVWRQALHIAGVRYHNIFLFIALFGIIDLFESFPLPRLWKRLLFFAGLLCCLVHGIMYHPQEREILRLYENIRRDAGQYSRVLGVSFEHSNGRHRYYTELPLVRADRPQPLAELVRGLKGNLSVYDGQYDAVYLFVGVKRSELSLLPELAALMPAERFQQIGFVWLNRYHKKALAIYRYLPAKEKVMQVPGALFVNGDFAQSATPRQRQQILARFGKRMPRLEKEKFDPPADWNFYVSLGAKTNSFFTRVKSGKDHALRLEANGYLCAITSTIKIPETKYLSFSVKAESEAMLEISRSVGAGLFPIILLPLKPGEAERYEVILPVYPGKEQSDIWFWLDHGTIELSDVRIR